MDIGKIYDLIANEYENNYSDERVGEIVEAENNYIKEVMPYQHGTILDCGSGTGLLIDLLGIKQNLYTGIDESKNMMQIAKKKYPQHKFLRGDVFQHKGLYDCVVSLFSVPDYCGIDIIKKSYDLLNEKGLFVSTFINADGAYKKIHCIEELGVDYEPHRFTYAQIKSELDKNKFSWYYILSICNIETCTDVQEMTNYLLNNKHNLKKAKYFFVMGQKI
jgi:SAM-dependent methyltransferase